MRASPKILQLPRWTCKRYPLLCHQCKVRCQQSGHSLHEEVLHRNAGQCHLFLYPVQRWRNWQRNRTAFNGGSTSAQYKTIHKSILENAFFTEILASVVTLAVPILLLALIVYLVEKSKKKTKKQIEADEKRLRANTQGRKPKLLKKYRKPPTKQKYLKQEYLKMKHPEDKTATITSKLN